jgi:aminoglycoside 6'-N-acetyltransferase I
VPGFVWNQDDFVTKQITNKEYFVLEQDGAVVAIMSLKKRKNKVSIDTLAVKKEFQGKGLGSQLVEFAKQYAKDNGFKSLHAYSFAEYNAVNFYLKQSFEYFDRTREYNGHRYDCFKINLQ